MSDVNLRELQLFQLDILKELDRICKKHQIKYFLFYGTCIGAVRHHGFIPWDDDIDVAMLAEDYLKFMDVCKTELGDKYYFQTHFDDAKSYIFWNRIGVKKSTSINLEMSDIHQPWGICLDIFPLFPVSDDTKEQNKRFTWLKNLELLSLKYFHLHDMHSATGITKLKKACHGLLPDRLNCYLFSYYFKKAAKSSTTTNTYVVASRYSPFLKAEWFSQTVDMPFEDMKLPCPINYHESLTKIYGDYMQVPDDKTKHSDDPNVIIKFNEPYQNYWK